MKNRQEFGERRTRDPCIEHDICHEHERNLTGATRESFLSYSKPQDQADARYQRAQKQDISARSHFQIRTRRYGEKAQEMIQEEDHEEVL